MFHFCERTDSFLPFKHYLYLTNDNSFTVCTIYGANQRFLSLSLIRTYPVSYHGVCLLGVGPFTLNHLTVNQLLITDNNINQDNDNDNDLVVPSCNHNKPKEETQAVPSHRPSLLLKGKKTKQRRPKTYEG